MYRFIDMNFSKNFLLPFLIFIFSIIALGTSLFLYIYWYMEVSAELEEIIQKFNLDPGKIVGSSAWAVILVLSILVGIILIGIFIIFVYHQKTFHLYRLQRNFINNFTHELKTPVTSLKLYLETFLKHDLSRADQKKYLGYLLKDVGRLSDNVNRILSLAKIEGKSFEGKFKKSDIFQFTRDFLANNNLFRDCEIRFHNPSGRKYPYLLNSFLFEMLLTNLISNSIKYNDSQVPAIDITFKSRKEELLVCFEDNGLGIQKGDLKRIFKLFYQGGRSEDMTAKGTGVGLYLVRKIAGLHKAKVWAANNKNKKGANITLAFKLKPELSGS